MPWMRYIPSVFAPWKRTAEEWYERANIFYTDLYGLVQARIVRKHLIPANKFLEQSRRPLEKRRLHLLQTLSRMLAGTG